MIDDNEELGPLPEPESRFDDIADRLAECNKWDEAISLAAFGEDLPDHARECGACAEILEDRRAVVNHLDLLPTPTARLRVPRRNWIPWAAAAAVILGAIGFFPREEKTKPVEEPPVATTVRIVDELKRFEPEAIAEALTRAPRDQLKEVRALGDYLRTEKESSRRYVAVRMLVHIGGSSAMQELMDAPPDAAVIAALGEMKAFSAVEHLIELLDVPELATPAAVALAKIGDERAVPPLVAGLPRHRRSLRRFGEAVYRYVDKHPSAELITLGDPAVTERLFEEAKSDAEFRDRMLDLADRNTLFQAFLDKDLRPHVLARPVPGLIRRLHRMLPDADAVRALAAIGSDEALEAIIKSGGIKHALELVDHERLAEAALPWVTHRRRAPRLIRDLPATEEFVACFRRALKVADARRDACRKLATLRDVGSIPKLLPLLRTDAGIAARTLAAITGEDFGTDLRAWRRWWHLIGRNI